MPFRCPYCAGLFCDVHRLPESHACPRIDLAKSPSQTSSPGTSAPPRASSYEYSITFGRPKHIQNRIYLGRKEAKHLLVAAVLVVAIGFSIVFYADYITIFGWTWSIASVFAIFLTASFLLHEMAHKVFAQRRGLWSEFRLTTWGAVVTLISVILPFKLISPGAVVISGPARLEDIGEISIAGPITNMAFSVAFLSASFAELPFPWWWLFVVLSMFNSTIAIFNLIPFGILDGYKIYNWNRKIWALSFAVSIVIAVLAYYSASPFINF